MVNTTVQKASLQVSSFDAELYRLLTQSGSFCSEGDQREQSGVSVPPAGFDSLYSPWQRCRRRIDRWRWKKSWIRKNENIKRRAAERVRNQKGTWISGLELTFHLSFKRVNGGGQVEWLCIGTCLFRVGGRLESDRTGRVCHSSLVAPSALSLTPCILKSQWHCDSSEVASNESCSLSPPWASTSCADTWLRMSFLNFSKIP